MSLRWLQTDYPQNITTAIFAVSSPEMPMSGIEARDFERHWSISVKGTQKNDRTVSSINPDCYWMSSCVTWMIILDYFLTEGGQFPRTTTKEAPCCWNATSRRTRLVMSTCSCKYLMIQRLGTSMTIVWVGWSWWNEMGTRRQSSAKSRNGPWRQMENYKRVCKWRYVSPWGILYQLLEGIETTRLNVSLTESRMV